MISVASGTISRIVARSAWSVVRFGSSTPRRYSSTSSADTQLSLWGGSSETGVTSSVTRPRRRAGMAGESGGEEKLFGLLGLLVIRCEGKVQTDRAGLKVV